jgi:arginyl-tRNA synthetase
MSTLTLTGLETLLGGLGLKTPIPVFPAADDLNKGLDIGRSYFADILCSLVKCDPLVAYNSIQWPNDIFNGDLTVILPKLSQGADYEALGMDLMTKVDNHSTSHGVEII